jgi:c-di-AMP phosphodiesterase-like protein
MARVTSRIIIDNRTNKGALVPTIFLLLELLLLLIVFGIITVFDNTALNIISAFALTLFFIVSTLVRYKYVLDRQQETKQKEERELEEARKQAQQRDQEEEE